MNAITAPALFSLSFQTKPDAGEEGLDFLRPDHYAAEQVLAEIADLLIHPDNEHVDTIRVARVNRRIDIRPITLDLPVLDTASTGWTVEVHRDGQQSRNFYTSRAEVLAQRLIELLTSHTVASFTIRK